MKDVTRYAAIILLSLGVMLLLWEFRSAVLLFVFSLAVAAVFRPGVAWLTKRGLPRGIAILLVYAFGLGVIIGLGVLAIPPLGRDLQRATDNFAIYYAHIQRVWAQGSPFQKAVADQLPPVEQLYEAIAGEQGAALVRNVLGFATTLFDALFSLVVVIMLAIYWTADNIHFERLWLSTLPADQRVRARNIWRDIEKGVGDYLRSEVLQSLIVGVLLGFIYGVLGLEYPVLLAIAGALAWMIPWLGAFLALVPAVLVGMAQSPLLGLYAAVVTLGVLYFLEVVVEPRMFNRRRYSSLLIVIMVVAMAEAFGLIGLVLAPPLAAALQILFTHLLAPPAPEVDIDETEEVHELKVHLEELRARAMQMENPPPHIANLTARLDRLIQRSDQLLRRQAAKRPVPRP